MTYKNIVGKQFGLLMILDEFKNEKGYRVCRCQCECGNIKIIYKNNITSGRTKSCGCLEDRNRRRFVDLSNRTFGRLKAVAPTDQRKDGYVVWECICKCGKTVHVVGRNLIRGETKSCGCLLKERSNISNQRFGHLLALYPDKTSKNSPRKWLCRCDCGNICSVSISNLRNGHTKSCGCLQDKEYRTLIDGTCLEVIASSKVSKNNRSGIKGVSYYSKTNSWIATLTFKGKRHYLGEYDNITAAAKARWKAEEEIIKPFIDEHRHLLNT
ncbi:AP2 domain-containing protein [Anaeropeptidivorans aminofermentans]|uniref:AP2 domain-containing protein n=1 Tax=Anaeropeptidivorans aminofermentans TaxID=2934315 RepID=UPI0020240D5F|nr:AP2 domain-containing protein [Anaeropeptidivorans aminofermentans]